MELQTLEQLKSWKTRNWKHNHNLEHKSDFNEICTTHPWEDRYKLVLNAKEAGLQLCTGGIFGLGETQENRISMLKSIASLEPMSVPLNFFHPNEALPII